MRFRAESSWRTSGIGCGVTRPEAFDLQSFANLLFGAFQSRAEYSEIVWRFVPEAADHARGHMFHLSQTMESEPEGSLIVRFKASGFLEMGWYLYSWGDKVEVLAPARLRKNYRRSDFPALP